MNDNYSNEKKTIYVLEGAADINKIETWGSIAVSTDRSRIYEIQQEYIEEHEHPVCRIFQYIDGEY